MSTSHEDRILTAIKKHRELRAQYEDSAFWSRAEHAAWRKLFTTRPATIAGVKALAGYFREIAEGWQADTQFLAAIETACDHLAAAESAIADRRLSA